MTTTPKKILRIDTSIRTGSSATRTLTDTFMDTLAKTIPGIEVTTRDLAAGLPLIDEAWANAKYTPADQRTDAQNKALVQSDDLIAEVNAADVLVIGLPVYNFTIPAGLKTWIDLIARVGVTFRYTEAGPEGLIKGKKAYVLLASGGTRVGGDNDFASTYLKYILGFMGIEDVTIIAADQMAVDAEATLAAANTRISDEVLALAKLDAAA